MAPPPRHNSRPVAAVVRVAPLASGVAVAWAWVRGGRRVGVSLGGGPGTVAVASITGGVVTSGVLTTVTTAVAVRSGEAMGGGVPTGTVGVPKGARVGVKNGVMVAPGGGVLVTIPGIGVGVFVTKKVAKGVGVKVGGTVNVGVAVAAVTVVAVGVGVAVAPGTVVAVGVGVGVAVAPVTTVGVGVGVGVTPKRTGCPPLA